MRNKLCVYKSCKSDSRNSTKDYMKDVFFIPFPKPKRSFEKCQKWIEWLGREDYQISRINLNTYVCSKHFVGGKGPTTDFPDPIHSPSQYVSILKIQTTHQQLALKPVNINVFANQINSLDNTVEPAQNLKALFENFIPPSGGAVFHCENVMKVIKLKDQTTLALYSVFINEEFCATYEALGRKLEKNSITSKLPEKINTKNSLRNVISFFNTSRTCCGNAESKYLILLENRKIKRGFHSQYTGGAHSENCTLLVQNISQIRCLFCLRQRSNLQVALSKKNKKSSTSKSHICNMSKDELAIKVRTKTEYISKLQAKVLRLKKNITMNIKKKGVQVDEKEHDNLIKILEACVKSSHNQNKPKFSQLFLATQLKMMKLKNKNTRRWDPVVMQWCMHMYAKSPSLYNALNESGIMILPSKSSLVASSTNIGVTPGFHDEVFLQMREEFQQQGRNSQEEHFSVVIDEVKIKEDLVFRVETGDVVGFTHLGNSHKKVAQRWKDKPLASHVLQFMVRGLTSGYKRPFAHFATNSLTADQLDLLLFESIQKLELIGFKVLCVVGDGAATNRKCFKMNCKDDVKCMNPFANDRFIYFISDAPHLIKTVRNCLANSKDGCTYRLMEIHGEKLLWSTIRKLYNADLNKPGNLRKLHKLSSEHIFLENRMKVKLATQILSQSVANALEKEYGEDCKELTRFVSTFNKWFDIMNVGHLLQGYHSRNQFLKPFYSANDWRLKWLKDVFLQYLNEWEVYVESLAVKIEVKKKMLLSQETLWGLRQTTKSMLELIPFLIGRGAKFILTAHFNQDQLEQLFSKHRQACRAGCNPTVYQYCRNTQRLQILEKGKAKIKVIGGNTEVVKNSENTVEEVENVQ